jgi:CheY-like chemotaxis protein
MGSVPLPGHIPCRDVAGNQAASLRHGATTTGRMMAKIMIVEDSAHQREFLATALRAAGHDVLATTNGSEALQRLESGGFDLILTDIFMPDCDGLELIRRIRAGDNALPIIAMSAAVRGDLFLRVAEQFGADATLDKTQLPGEIAAAVAGVLAVHRRTHRSYRDAG